MNENEYRGNIHHVRVRIGPPRVHPEYGRDECCLFGVAVRDNSGVYFVDDCSVTLDLLH
jgi:hypothetical protein